MSVPWRQSYACRWRLTSSNRTDASPPFTLSDIQVFRASSIRSMVLATHRKASHDASRSSLNVRESESKVDRLSEDASTLAPDGCLPRDLIAPNANTASEARLAHDFAVDYVEAAYL